MTDTHNHLLPGIDDGSFNLEVSLEMLRELHYAGFRQIITTPHYITGTAYSANNELKQAKIAELETAIARSNLDIKLKMGNEIFIDADIADNLAKGNIAPISERYLLIELPMHEPMSKADQVIKNLQADGYRVIIAHPERYSYLQEDFRYAKFLKKCGVAFQCNFGSIIGVYGPRAQATLLKLLSKNMVAFLGTDLHRPETPIMTEFSTIKSEFISQIGTSRFNKILHNNELLFA